MASETLKLTLKGVRLSFPRLFKPKAFAEGQEATYGAAFIFDKKTQAAQIKQIRDAINAMCIAKWKKPLPVDKICFQDGIKKADVDGYGPGVYFMSTSSKRRVFVGKVEDGQIVPVEEADGVVFAGCFVNATVQVWLQDNKWGKRANCQLRAVCYVKDGESFGEGPVNPDEEFADMLGEAEDDSGLL